MAGVHRRMVLRQGARERPDLPRRTASNNALSSGVSQPLLTATAHPPQTRPQPQPANLAA